MSDPYYEMNIPGHFFEFCTYIELLVEFPLAAYLLYALTSTKPLSGQGELAATVYALVSGLCTVIVCNDLFFLGPEVIGQKEKSNLLYQAYVPFAVAGE